MGYNGSAKIVSSSFLYSTLQSFYTKIKGLLDNKADKTHEHSISELLYSSTIDLSASTYSQDTYYPVVGGSLPYNGFNRIKVAVQLNSGTKPSWSTHERGFTCNMDLLVVANGWGITRAQTIALDYSYLWTDSNPCGYQQLNCASLPVLWLRGGGKYFVWHDYDTEWSIKTSEFTSNDDKVSPTKTNPGMQFIYSNVYAHLKGNADTATNADTLDGYHASSFVKLGYGATTDWDTLVEGGMYRIDDISGQTSCHGEMASYGQLLVIRGIGDTICQLFCNYANNKIFSRTANGVGGTQVNWTSWKRINDGGNAETATTATTSSFSQNLNSTGFGNGTLTYVQTSGDFYDNTGWCHYIIANHGNGETYYNHTIALPFWDVPMYQRQEGNTSSRRGWQKFYTTENITSGTSALTPGSSTLKSGHIYLQYE